LKNNDTFSDRLVILLLHFSFFLKIYKNSLSKEEAQDLFDFIVRQIELSIREIGYGDVSVNKKMKDYVNLFYSILEKIENWDTFDGSKKTKLLRDLMNIKDDNDLFIEYFDKYSHFLSKNSLKNFTKDILEFKF
jgi:cytochrome b pre-mRNA-processing protein 3